MSAWNFWIFWITWIFSSVTVPSAVYRCFTPSRQIDRNLPWTKALNVNVFTHCTLLYYYIIICQRLCSNAEFNLDRPHALALDKSLHSWVAPCQASLLASWFKDTLRESLRPSCVTSAGHMKVVSSVSSVRLLQWDQPPGPGSHRGGVEQGSDLGHHGGHRLDPPGLHPPLRGGNAHTSPLIILLWRERLLLMRL